MAKRPKTSTPKKRPGPSDPTPVAPALQHKHAGRIEESETPPHGDPLREKLAAKPEAKGPDASGAERPSRAADKQLREAAMKAAQARWAGRKKN